MPLLTQDTQGLIFRNISNEEYRLSDMTDEIKKFIEEDQDSVYNLIIGSDSLYQAKETAFVSAVIIHRVGKGARFFYTKTRVKHDMDICSRLLRETHDSITIMKEIEQTNILLLVNEFSIHIDAGTNGDSRKILKECIAYVKALGYTYKIKPDACAASTVADRFTK